MNSHSADVMDGSCAILQLSETAQRRSHPMQVTTLGPPYDNGRLVRRKVAVTSCRRLIWDLEY